jgi:hypothetical protein
VHSSVVPSLAAVCKHSPFNTEGRKQTANLEVFAAEYLRTPLLWDITLHQEVIGSRRFGGTCYFHFQGCVSLGYQYVVDIQELFTVESEGSTFFRNVGVILACDTAVHLCRRRTEASKASLSTRK